MVTPTFIEQKLLPCSTVTSVLVVQWLARLCKIWRNESLLAFSLSISNTFQIKGLYHILFQQMAFQLKLSLRWSPKYHGIKCNANHEIVISVIQLSYNMDEFLEYLVLCAVYFVLYCRWIDHKIEDIQCLLFFNMIKGIESN